jgi:aconitate hydratase
VTLDLTTIKPSVAGPKRPQDRIELGNLKGKFTELFSKPIGENGFAKNAADLTKRIVTARAADGVGAISDASMQVPGNGQPRDLVEMVDNRPTPDPFAAWMANTSRSATAT